MKKKSVAKRLIVATVLFSNMKRSITTLKHSIPVCASKLRHGILQKIFYKV